MTGPEFDALERRLAPVPGGGWSWEYSREVGALLRECRALRAFAPPALAALEQVSWVFETLDSLRAEAGPDERLATKLRHHLAAARGRLLAALGARPPGAEAGHDAGDRQLDKVLRDGAELGRLRQPPDVAGLMPAAELARVRAWVDEGPSSAPAALAGLLRHADVLSALARELYGVVADLHADDPGRQALLERGRAEGREEAARLAESRAGFAGTGSTAQTLAHLAGAVRALGPCRPPLPPQEVEREAARLREALRQCLERLEWASERDGLSPLHFAHAITDARGALEGSPPA